MTNRVVVVVGFCAVAWWYGTSAILRPNAWELELHMPVVFDLPISPYMAPGYGIVPADVQTPDLWQTPVVCPGMGWSQWCSLRECGVAKDRVGRCQNVGHRAAAVARIKCQRVCNYVALLIVVMVIIIVLIITVVLPTVIVVTIVLILIIAVVLPIIIVIISSIIVNLTSTLILIIVVFTFLFHIVSTVILIVTGVIIFIVTITCQQHHRGTGWRC